MFQKILSLALVACALSACGPRTAVLQEESSDQQGIIGGERVQSGDPVGVSTVGLYDKKAKALCTGTLIGEQIILTAGHCVDPNSNDLVVYFGTNFKQPDPNLVRKVIKAVVHPSYNTSRGEDIGDVALVRFEGLPPQGFKPAPLLKDFIGVLKNTRVVVAGYGLDWSWIVKAGSGILRTVELRIQDPFFSKTEMMIDQSIRKGICSGDSGGPAYLNINGTLFVVGVASRGDSIPIPLTPNCFIMSIFTRVDAYANWIQATAYELQLIR